MPELEDKKLKPRIGPQLQKKVTHARIMELVRLLGGNSYTLACDLKDNEVIQCCVGEDVQNIICIHKDQNAERISI